MDNECPNKFKCLTGDDSFGVYCDLKGQRIKFTLYRKKSKSTIIRGRIVTAGSFLIVLNNVKMNRKFFEGNQQFQFQLRDMHLFEFPKLCEQGKKKYPYLCQKGIEKRLEGRAVSETTSHTNRKYTSERKVPFWHKLDWKWKWR